MRHLTQLSLIFIFILTCGASAPAQSQPTKEPTPDKPSQGSYIRRNVGKETTEVDATKKDPFSSLPISSWMGERFIFLPRQKSLQRYGYQSVHKPKEEFGSLPYDKYMGRIAKVTAVTQSRTGLSGAYEVEFTLEDTNEKVKARAVLGKVEGLALVRDIDNARALYLGKTLWLKDSTLRTYNEDTGKANVIGAKRYSPVKVTDIVAGWHEYSPVRFVIQTTSGEEGFIDISMSDTNASESLTAYHKFKKYFLTEDPRITHPWSDKIWAVIDEGKVFVGMTAEQALMSWGEPSDINTTTTGSDVHDQWVYGSRRYLYFKNGILTSIQE